MRTLLLCITLFSSFTCVSQAKNIYGTYFCTFSYFGSKVTSILKLDSNNAFNYYENIDEGDVTAEALSSGKYFVANDSLTFESVYDSSYNTGGVMNMQFINFSNSRFRMSGSTLQSSNFIKTPPGDKLELQTFYKLDFLQLDSIKATAFTRSAIQEIIIDKEMNVQFSSTVKKHFRITNNKYGYILSRLAGINFFSLLPRKIDSMFVAFGCIELFAGGRHLSVCGNYFSKDLYEVLFIDSLNAVVISD